MSAGKIFRKFRFLFILLFFAALALMYSCADSLCPAYTGQSVYNAREMHKFTKM